jgi:hypothetical protein
VTGLPRTLGADVPALEKIARFHTMGLVTGGFTGTRALRNSKAEVSGTKIVEYFESCLKQFGYRLLPAAAEHISRLTAEVLNNCEDHSGRPEWWMAAYLRLPQPLGSDDISVGPGDFHLTIFNFGASIAETLDAALREHPNSAQARERVTPILLGQQRSNVTHFGSHSRAATLCVCALQPSISRYNTSEDPKQPGDRGQGTVQFIESFSALGAASSQHAEEPEAVVLSGNIHMRLGRQRIADGYFLEHPIERVIALNASNDIGKPPDGTSVSVLNGHFPGTIISLRFMLDSKHLATQSGYVEPNKN